MPMSTCLHHDQFLAARGLKTLEHWVWFSRPFCRPCWCFPGLNFLFCSILLSSDSSPPSQKLYAILFSNQAV